MIEYDTLRKLSNISEDNHGILSELISRKKDYNKILKPQKGKRIIVLERAVISEKNEIQKGLFKGGIFKGIEFYNAQNGLNGHIWFEGGGHATGLDNLYDIMFIDSIRIIPEKNHEQLKIFNFGAFSGGESENSNVIETDPFLAYKTLIDNKIIISSEQHLTSVELVKRGKTFYSHKIYDYSGDD